MGRGGGSHSGTQPLAQPAVVTSDYAGPQTGVVSEERGRGDIVGIRRVSEAGQSMRRLGSNQLDVTKFPLTD